MPDDRDQDEGSPAHHREQVSVRWGDLDSMGHVNNACYFTYCESARMSYFRAVRMEEHVSGGRFGPALAAASLNFRRQVRYPADIEVATCVVEIGRSSFKMEYVLTQTSPGERTLVADGTGVIVWTDYSTGRSAPLPDGLRETIRQREGMAGVSSPGTPPKAGYGSS
jgi:acyl-CoA thioester hydrolase